MLVSFNSLSSFNFFSLQGIYSLTMSSFPSNSIIGMGSSDSRGSIQQPLVDREVISIGGSSSKDTCHGSFNNESSSLERLRVLRRAGGDISRLRGRAQPFPASPPRKPIPVTIILPPSVSRGARQSERDVRASPRVRRNHSARSLLSFPAIASFKWARDDVLKYKSSITSATSVTTLQRQVKLANPEDSYKTTI